LIDLRRQAADLHPNRNHAANTHTLTGAGPVTQLQHPLTFQNQWRLHRTSVDTGDVNKHWVYTNKDKEQAFKNNQKNN